MQNIGVLRGQNIHLRIFNATAYQPRTNDVQGPIRGTMNNRFLYNMMRMLSGTLVQVGLGKLSVDDVAALLRARGRKGVHDARGREVGPPKAVVFKAPPQGLCLETCFLEHEHGPWTVPMVAPKQRAETAGADGQEAQAMH